MSNNYQTLFCKNLWQILKVNQNNGTGGWNKNKVTISWPCSFILFHVVSEQTRQALQWESQPTHHVTSQLPNHVTNYVTSHVTNHVTSLLTNHVTCHMLPTHVVLILCRAYVVWLLSMSRSTTFTWNGAGEMKLFLSSTCTNICHPKLLAHFFLNCFILCS